MKEPLSLLLLGLLFLVPLAARAGTGRPESAQERDLDAPYVPTREPVVAEMLRLAAVGKKDVLYDLGCGDGRIVIAARRLGARAVGVDINPYRIAECEEFAARAGVGSGVRFVVGDLFEADIREATVVALYLLTTVNLRLRPRLLAELRPGTRIVSHDFGMDTWKPDLSSQVTVDGRAHAVHVWTVPANVGGRWTWTMGKPSSSWELVLVQTFQFAVGTLTRDGTPLPVRAIEIRGDTLGVAVDGPEGMSIVFEGKASRNSVAGTARFLAPGGRTMKWSASRDPLTAKPLDLPEGSAVFRFPRRGAGLLAPPP